jgi:tetratricopeptide (TPR) repeat protein
MSDFATGYFIIFGGLALFGTVAAIYFYLQDRKEAQMEDRPVPRGASLTAKHSMAPEPTNGNWSKATAYFEKALALSETIGDSQGRALALRNLGKLCAKQGDIVKARNFFENALAIYEELGDKLAIARIYNELGLLFSHGFESEGVVAEKVEN